MVTLRSYVTADSWLDIKRKRNTKKSIQNVKKIKLTRNPIQFPSQDQESRFNFELNQRVYCVVYAAGSDSLLVLLKATASHAMIEWGFSGYATNLELQISFVKDSRCLPLQH